MNSVKKIREDDGVTIQPDGILMASGCNERGKRMSRDWNVAGDRESSDGSDSILSSTVQANR